MYKLTYFDITFRGEPARLIFAAAGVKFVDNRIQFEDWPALKKTLEWGQLPLLEVGDKTITQSGTMYRYLARKFKLTGSDEWEAAKCDELVDAIGDLNEEFITIEWKEKDPAKKEERKKTFNSTILPNFLSKLNKIQMANGGKWLVGKSMTYADIMIAETLRQFLEMGWVTTDLGSYPNVKNMKDGVFANAGIKQFKSTGK